MRYINSDGSECDYNVPHVSCRARRHIVALYSQGLSSFLAGTLHGGRRQCDRCEQHPLEVGLSEGWFSQAQGFLLEPAVAKELLIGEINVIKGWGCEPPTGMMRNNVFVCFVFFTYMYMYI